MKACVRSWLEQQMPGMGDEMYSQIYDEYVSTAKRLVGEIAAIDKTAHTLKGNALMVGDNPMADAAIAIRGKISELQGLLAEL